MSKCLDISDFVSKFIGREYFGRAARQLKLSKQQPTTIFNIDNINNIGMMVKVSACIGIKSQIIQVYKEKVCQRVPDKGSQWTDLGRMRIWQDFSSSVYERYFLCGGLENVGNLVVGGLLSRVSRAVLTHPELQQPIKRFKTTKGFQMQKVTFWLKNERVL